MSDIVITNKNGNAERETIFTIVANDRSTVHIFTDDPVMAAKLQKKGWVPNVVGPGHLEFDIPARGLSIRNSNKSARVLSDEQKEAARDRLEKARRDRLNKDTL